MVNAMANTTTITITPINIMNPYTCSSLNDLDELEAPKLSPDDSMVGTDTIGVTDGTVTNILKDIKQKSHINNTE